MNRILMMVVVAMMTMMTVNAQSLTGKEWCTMIPDEDGQQIALEMKFENNATCEIEIAAVQDMKESGMKMSIAMELDIPGTYRVRPRLISTLILKAWTLKPRL